MTEIPNPRHENYSQWVRQTALNAMAQIVAGQITERTHVSVTKARMEKLIPWAETYLKTGGFPPSNR